MRFLQSLSVLILLGTQAAKAFAPSSRIQKPIPISPISKFPRSNVPNHRSIETSPFHARGRPLQAIPSMLAGAKALHSNTSYVLAAVLWLSAFGVSGLSICWWL